MGVYLWMKNLKPSPFDVITVVLSLGFAYVLDNRIPRQYDASM